MTCSASVVMSSPSPWAGLVCFDHGAGEPLGGDERVGGAHPLPDLLPSLVVSIGSDRQRNPSVAAEAVARGADGRIGGDDGCRLLAGELDREVLGLDVGEDEVLATDPERRVIAPFCDVDALGFGQLVHDVLETLHVRHGVSPLGCWNAPGKERSSNPITIGHGERPLFGGGRVKHTRRAVDRLLAWAWLPSRLPTRPRMRPTG